MDTAKKVIKKIRHQIRTLLPPERHPELVLLDEFRTGEFWERDKKTKRDQNFAKAKLRLEEYREEQRLEKLRQEEIAEARLKNLKKARRKLRQLQGE